MGSVSEVRAGSTATARLPRLELGLTLWFAVFKKEYRTPF